jgi:hypothetical protein
MSARCQFGLKFYAAPRQCLPSKPEESIMLDLAAIAALLVFFGLGALFVRACDII